LFHVTGTCKHICCFIWNGYWSPVVSAMKGIEFLFAVSSRVELLHAKLEKYLKYSEKVLSLVIIRMYSSKFQKDSDFLKISLTIRGFYIYESLQYTTSFHADPIWCVGTFKCWGWFRFQWYLKGLTSCSRVIGKKGYLCLFVRIHKIYSLLFHIIIFFD
jgi:hypothetical protein